MDKLIEKDGLYRRFSCDCLSPDHVLDVAINAYAENDRECWLHLFLVGMPFRRRLKQVWDILRGRDVDRVDFIVRGEDIGHLADTIRQADTTKYEMH